MPTFSFKNAFASATAFARVIVAFGFGGGFVTGTKIVFWCGVAGGLFALAGFFGFFTTAGGGGVGGFFADAFFFAVVVFAVAFLPAAFVFFVARFAAIESERTRSQASAARMSFQFWLTLNSTQSLHSNSVLNL